jgi:hypothetical protein
MIDDQRKFIMLSHFVTERLELGLVLPLSRGLRKARATIAVANGAKA